MSISLHHALSIEAEAEPGKVWAHSLVRDVLGLTIQGNPDIETIECERYTIAEARQLKIRASQTPLGSAQVFIIICENILREAQNALLKLFEEPSPQTFFIIVMPSVEGLLPTVRSRLSHQGRLTSEPVELAFARKFLTAPVGERILMLQPILKEKNRSRARTIVDALESELHAKGVSEKPDALQQVYFVRNYLADRSSSLKMLLEHLAVTL